MRQTPQNDQDDSRGGNFQSTPMRILDLLAGAGLLIFFLPIMVLVMATTMMCNRGGAFRKVSKTLANGRSITVLNYQCENSTRAMTRYNRFLMKTGLVALPEFINVMTGELSLFKPNVARPSIFSF